MRLIDADALLVELDEWENTEENSDRALGVVDAKVIACQMSTVDAIPVEWIQKYYANHPFTFASGMLYDWAMEQAERKEE